MCIFLEEENSENPWRVFGEATNETGGSQEEVEVKVTFFAADGSSVAGDVGYILTDIMPAGTTLPFDIMVESPVAPAEYKFDISSIPGEITPQDLQVTNTQLTYVEDELVVTGQVHNPEPDLLYYAELIATLYNEQGAVVAVGYEFVSAEKLRVSASAPFTISTVGLFHLATDCVVVALGF